MKKFLLALIVILGLSYAAYAEEFTAEFQTMGFSNDVPITDIQLNDYLSLKFDRADGDTDPVYHSTGKGMRLYPGNTLTISARRGYVITSVVGTADSNSNNFPETTTVSSGDITGNNNKGKTTTWTGETNQLVITPNLATGKVVRVQKFVITYDKIADYPYTDVTMSFEGESKYKVNYADKDQFVTPALVIDPEEAREAVVYESSNVGVAYVAPDGVVTILNTGNTTITASIPEYHEKYSSISSVSYDIQVVGENEMQTELDPTFFNHKSGSNKKAEKVDETTGIKFSAVYYYKNPIMEIGASRKGSCIVVTETNPKYLIKSVTCDFASTSTGVLIYKKDTEFPTPNTSTVVSMDGATLVTETPVTSDTPVDVNAKAFAIIPNGAGVSTINSVTVIYEPVDESGDPIYICEDFTNMMICEGETVELNLGDDAPAINFISTDESVAVVEGNTIKAVGPGFTTIAATWEAVDGKWKAGAEAFTVNVKYKDLASVLANVKEGQTYVGNFPIIVVSDNGYYNYVTDQAHTAWALFYVDHNHGDGTVIPAGWTGVYTEAYGVPQFDIIDHDEVDETVTVDVNLREYSDIEITESMRNQVVVLLNVTFAEDAPAEEGEFTGTFNGKDYLFYNQLECVGASAGTYNVKCVVDIDPDRGLEIFPIEYYDTNAVTAAPSHDVTKVYAENDVIEFIGVEDGAVILYRHGGENPDHTNVFTEPAMAPRKVVTADMNEDLTYNHTTHPLTFNGQEINVKYMAKKPGKAPSAVQSLAIDSDGATTGIENVAVDASHAEAEYYNLQGQRVKNPSAGIYIVRQGNKVRKVLVK